jgi:2',3'-cyclic-nucleotide 2'-phosphodiesterase (5'-nucleotidase family)
LLLDGGDSLVADESQPLTGKSQSALIIEAMNLMRYDATVLGERDLQLGAEALSERINEAEFVVLSANVRLADGGELFAKPYTILETGGWTFGIVGLTGSDPGTPPEFYITDPFIAIEGILPALSEETDWIVVLSHLGWTENKHLADLAPEIHLIVSGGAETPDQAPYSASTTGAYVAQAERPSPGHAGRQIGRWDLELGADDQMEVNTWKSVRLGPEFTDDLALRELLRRYHDLFPTN